MKVRIRLAKPHSAHIAFPLMPLGENIRAAQIGPWPTLRDVIWCPADSWHGLSTLRPRIVAGPRHALRRLSQFVRVWHLNYSFLDTAVYCLTNLGERPLTGDFRDEVWETFGVPVFEIFVSGDGQILARECEAHDGWHVNTKAAGFLKLTGEPHLVMERRGGHGEKFDPMGVGFAGDITTELCACGVASPRLINLPIDDYWCEDEEVMALTGSY